MGKQTTTVDKAQQEAAWRERIARQVANGQGVAAFCRAEAIAEATFYGWRARLRDRDLTGATTQPGVAAPAAFLDLGVVKPMRASALVPSMQPLPSPGTSPMTGIELRIELGDGIVLHLARH